MQIDLDFEREQRQGFGEAIYGAGKNAEQMITITHQHIVRKVAMLVTRLSLDIAKHVIEKFPDEQFTYHEVGSCLTYRPKDQKVVERAGLVALVSAGSSDLQVVQEAAHTLEFFGVKRTTIFDCGVAGIHRLLKRQDELLKADLCIVVAGMDGALPSVVPFP